MNKILNIIFIKTVPTLSNKFDLYTKNNNIFIKLNIKDLTNFEINLLINNIKDFIILYNNIHIKFKNNISDLAPINIIAILNNFTYSFLKPKFSIDLYTSNQLLSDSYIQFLKSYKDIVINPNKNPNIFLNYILKNIPNSYTFTKFTNNSKLFPLTNAVGKASLFNNYFLHIKPKREINKAINIFLIGKGVTFDTGGLNIKTSNMQEMKIDMAGSSLLINLLNFLHINKKDRNKNFHLLLPIVENSIGSKSILPGSVITTLSGKTIEINDTDAEGRLIIVDAIEYFNIKILKKYIHKNNFIFDIATLTGNTLNISCGISSITTGNDFAIKKNYINDLIKTGQKTMEYVDFLELRNEYLNTLKSNVADIKNMNVKCHADSIIAASFINFFVPYSIPWIHLDIASVVTSNNSDNININSYGLHLLYRFFSNF